VCECLHVIVCVQVRASVRICLVGSKVYFFFVCCASVCVCVIACLCVHMYIYIYVCVCVCICAYVCVWHLCSYHCQRTVCLGASWRKLWKLLTWPLIHKAAVAARPPCKRQPRWQPLCFRGTSFVEPMRATCLLHAFLWKDHF
jgi:hypothetical protein